MRFGIVLPTRATSTRSMASRHDPHHAEAARCKPLVQTLRMGSERLKSTASVFRDQSKVSSVDTSQREALIPK
jgi:hypothetical protein